MSFGLVTQFFLPHRRCWVTTAREATLTMDTLSTNLVIWQIRTKRSKGSQFRHQHYLLVGIYEEAKQKMSRSGTIEILENHCI